jgi:pyruvate/2-oxoglutarate/acetoin dehydrogenase E1 component
LLKSAIRDDNPVAFLEPKILYQAEEEVPEEEYTIPIGLSNKLSQGSDLTIAAYGYQVSQAKQAIRALPQYSIELIDLQSLSPLDLTTILDSISKTRRLLIVQEDYAVCSIAEHIAFWVYSNFSADVKVKIVSAKYAPIPFSPPLEEYILPQVSDIVAGIKEILE